MARKRSISKDVVLKVGRGVKFGRMVSSVLLKKSPARIEGCYLRLTRESKRKVYLGIWTESERLTGRPEERGFDYHVIRLRAAIDPKTHKPVLHVE